MHYPTPRAEPIREFAKGRSGVIAENIMRGKATVVRGIGPPVAS
jgi:hypothetical protein